MLDPLAVNPDIENNTNEVVLSFLYRSLLSFSPIENRIVSDLATCSLETFPVVRCTLKPSALWSDGSPITTQDIMSTY